MDASIRRAVRERAADCCEYCQLPQTAVDATFHVDHVIARQHVDQTDDHLDGLALACDRCNFCKATNLSSIDPDTDEIVLLFNPREDAWKQHFAFRGTHIIGRTPTGRASARLLQMNARHRVELRKWLLEEKQQ